MSSYEVELTILRDFLVSGSTGTTPMSCETIIRLVKAAEDTGWNERVELQAIQLDVKAAELDRVSGMETNAEIVRIEAALIREQLR